MSDAPTVGVKEPKRQQGWILWVRFPSVVSVANDSALAQAPPAACPNIASMTEIMHQGGYTDPRTAPKGDDFLLAGREEGCWRGYQIRLDQIRKKLTYARFLARKPSVLRIKILTVAFRKKS